PFLQHLLSLLQWQPLIRIIPIHFFTENRDISELVNMQDEKLLPIPLTWLILKRDVWLGVLIQTISKILVSPRCHLCIGQAIRAENLIAFGYSNDHDSTIASIGHAHCGAYYSSKQWVIAEI